MVQSGDGLHGCLLSPSLRGSGLKSQVRLITSTPAESPSLRGSGLRACVHSKKVV